jgi:hypothetical protein
VLRQWKADQIDRCSATLEAEIADAVRTRNFSFFFKAAEDIGLELTDKGKSIVDQPPPTPAAGSKRTASGSVPRGRKTPATPQRPSLARAVKNTPSPAGTLRGHASAPAPANTVRMADPSPSPQPKNNTKSNTMLPIQGQSGLPAGESTLRPNAAANPTGRPNVQTDALTAALQQALAPLVARLDALERKAMPPPPLCMPVMNSRGTTQDPPPPPPPQTGNGAANVRAAPTPAVEGNRAPAVQNINKGRKNAGKTRTPMNNNVLPNQIIITLATYAEVAATVPNDAPKTAGATHKNKVTPAITEVTVIRTGGLFDIQEETALQKRAADAIVREVRANMAKAVSNPIPLKAGRWSIHPCSRGNFVFSFNGNIPFDLLSSYERILLAPFKGCGQLCPSLGWTRLLAHGVPALDEGDCVFGPGTLLREVQSLPGLKKAFFTMPPRWLKPVGEFNAKYSTLTFAISDPDGSITNNLMKKHTALFGKEVKIERWVDKPALIQCSRCHALGHNKSSKACTFSPDSVRCYRCGGAHKSEEHDQKCTRRHAVAGVCDCTHFKCLNCQGMNHHCREIKCPARKAYHPNSRRAKKDKGKGKESVKEVSLLDSTVSALFYYWADC